MDRTIIYKLETIRPMYIAYCRPTNEWAESFSFINWSICCSTTGVGCSTETLKIPFFNDHADGRVTVNLTCCGRHIWIPIMKLCLLSLVTIVLTTRTERLTLRNRLDIHIISCTFPSFWLLRSRGLIETKQADRDRGVGSGWQIFYNSVQLWWQFSLVSHDKTLSQKWHI